MKRILEYQGWHLLAFVILAMICYQFSLKPAVAYGSVFGVATLIWYWAAVLVALGHQMYVVFSWRSELYHQWFSKHFGENSLRNHSAIFFTLIVLRPILIVVVAISNAGTLAIPDPLNFFAIALCTILGGYTLYCTARYFGFVRATGADHFDPKYRQMGLVTKGIFSLIPNAMYSTAMLVLWLPGLVAHSSAALIVAVFQHIFVWVHYFATERPDMKEIYRS